MAALKLWGLELPNMALLVQGGSSHPWQLIRVRDTDGELKRMKIP